MPSPPANHSSLNGPCGKVRGGLKDVPGAREGPHPSGDDSRSDLPAAVASLPFPSRKARGRLKTCLRVAAPLASRLSGVEDAEPAGPPSFNFGVEPPPAWAEPGRGRFVCWLGELDSAVGGSPTPLPAPRDWPRERGRQVGARLSQRNPRDDVGPISPAYLLGWLC